MGRESPYAAAMEDPKPETETPAPMAPLSKAVPEQLPDVPAAPLPAAHAAGSDAAKWRFPPVHPEGLRIGGIMAAVALLAFLFGWWPVGWLLAAFAAFTATFFRDPVRASPGGAGLIISPADGLVSQIMEVELPRQVQGDGGLAPGRALRISIFMSVFDVHINRSPIAGTVSRLAYVPGSFLNADLDKASEENERQYFVITGTDGTMVAFTQIAGLIARRIIGFVREGTMVAAGQRIGLIRFGSRVDIFLPAGYQPQVVKGQRAVAGETVLAARGVAAAVPGALQ